MASSLLGVGLQGLANYCAAGAKICKSTPTQRHFYADLRRFAQILGIFMLILCNLTLFFSEAESTFVLIHILMFGPHMNPLNFIFEYELKIWVFLISCFSYVVS